MISLERGQHMHMNIMDYVNYTVKFISFQQRSKLEVALNVGIHGMTMKQYDVYILKLNYIKEYFYLLIKNHQIAPCSKVLARFNDLSSTHNVDIFLYC